MRISFKYILLLMCCLSTVCSFSQTFESPNLFSDFEVLVSKWKGFEKQSFKFNENDAQVIIPQKALTGNPWIWRARFPEKHNKTDSILVSKGFYLAYVNTNDLYGNKEAIAIWDKFYKLIVEKYKLQKKVALMGRGKGSLLIYNWANKNPERVACICGLTPVCDIKSWPAGNGEGIGSIDDWEKLKKAYGFKSDSEAYAFKGNPLNYLKHLASYKIPILHTVDLNDSVVPMEENTLPLINKYIKLGGSALVVPFSSTEQGLDTHDFDIKYSKQVANFISFYTAENHKLKSIDYHAYGAGYKNSYIKFEKLKKGRVAFLGGSITHNSGWRDSITGYLMKRFPKTKFDFIEAGIPSTGTTPAAFRLERDVLKNGPIDLLFEEAAVNDAVNKRTNQEQLRGMEGVIRYLRRVNPEIDIIMMHFVDPSKISDYNKGIIPKVIQNHNQVAKHYNVGVINLAKEVSDRISNKEFTWKDDFKNLHPSPFGQGVYARSIIKFLEDVYSSHLDADDKVASHDLPGPLDKESYDNGFLLDVVNLKASKGWRLDKNWKPNDDASTRKNFVDAPMLISNTPKKTYRLKFKGKAIGMAYAAGPDAGILEYRVDKGGWKTLNLFSNWSKHFHLPVYSILFTGLSNKTHTVEMRLKNTKDKRSIGNVCRIRYFLINRF